MAVYAAVVSLMNNMEQIRNHRRLSTCFDNINSQMESLGEYLEFFLEFVECYSYLGEEEVGDLEMRITSAAHAAEDVIETHVVDQIQSGFAEESRSLSVDLEKIIEEMSLIKEVVLKVKEGKMPNYVEQPTISTAPYGCRDATMVERHDHLNEILDRLIGGSPDLEIISIIGPKCIGKSTLARNAYENPIVTNHFYFRAWAPLYMSGLLSYTLRRLLSCLGRSTHKLEKLGEDELGKELKRMLSGKRYLIILDDIDMSFNKYMKEAWDRLKYFLPENKDGSRVIMTYTPRDLLAKVSTYVHEVRPLGDLESWEVLRQMVFGHQNCPPQLEATGREIAKYCLGYPLFISLIAGCLRKSSRKPEFWEHAATSLSPINNLDEFYRRSVIMMKFTYDALPSFLKPCLFYIETLTRSCDIRVSRFVKFWVAEGFLKPNKGLTLEEVAENCISDLIDRNLIYVSSRGSNGKPRFCKINSSFGFYCGKMNDKETFVSLLSERYGSPEVIPNVRRLKLFYLSTTVNGVGDYRKKFHATESALLARSMICCSTACASFKSRLLRVLHQVYSDCLEATFEQVNLRLLDYEWIHAPIAWMQSYNLPSSISLLWSVQTLIFGKKIELVVAPSQIWEMRDLRHLHFYRIFLPIPAASDDEDDVSILQNLQTLRTAVNLECNKEVHKRMPNVKKLRVFYNDLLGEEGQRKYWYSLFTKLESLHCFRKFPNRDDLLRNLKLPSSLKKLVLQYCELRWSDMSIIGSLPFLEVLKLKCQSVRGPMWETIEGEFVRLKFLEIDSCYLIYWSAGASNFPFLEKLVLQRLYRLKEIPPEIGEIPTLEEIYVVECSISVAMSAARIKEKRKQRGQRETKFRVGLRKEEEVEEFEARMESDGIRSNGLQISGF